VKLGTQVEPDSPPYSRPMSSWQLAFLHSCLMALVCARASAAPGMVFQTSVTPQPDEDLAASCRYELTVMAPARMIKGVWVIFERGRDMVRYYEDPDVRSFARRHDWALLMPFHCAAKSYSDMDMDPQKGIGRALLTALTQLADASHHPELTSAKLVLLGFSGTGALAPRLAAYAPERVVAVVASDPGHFDPLGVDAITLSARAASIPELILAGSADAVSGTERPYAFFRRYFDNGAPWTFVVQNGTPHCCIINAKDLVLSWLDAVVIHRRTRAVGWYGFIKIAQSTIAECPDPQPPARPVWCRGTKDSWGGNNWSVSAATTARHSGSQPAMLPAGWLPTRAFAQQWLLFVRLAAHPVTSLP
jgi:pimeloyl-ACP methyl ester carboxylesterase